MGRVCSTSRGRGMHIGMVGKAEEKRPLGSPKRRWVDKIKMYLRDIGCGGMD
jgi:hypothetical protein